MSRLPSATRSAITLLASTLVATGSMLPWLRIDPAHEAPVALVSLPGMESGLDLWGPILVPAVLGLGVLHGVSSRSAANVATLAVGGLVLGLLTQFGQSSFGGYYVPAVGWYLSAVGGLLLVGVGVERLWSRFGYRLSGTDDPRSL